MIRYHRRRTQHRSAAAPLVQPMIPAHGGKTGQTGPPSRVVRFGSVRLGSPLEEDEMGASRATRPFSQAIKFRFPRLQLLAALALPLQEEDSISSGTQILPRPF